MRSCLIIAVNYLKANYGFRAIINNFSVCDWLIMIWVMTNYLLELGWKVRLWRFQRLSNKRRHGSVGDSESDKSIFFLSTSILPQVIPPILCHLAFRLSISSLEKKSSNFL